MDNIKYFWWFVIITAAANSYAGWPTNAWPSYDYPRHGVQQISNTYAAVAERSFAMEVSSAVTNMSLLALTNYYYRGYRELLKDVKTWVADNAQYFVDPMATNNVFLGDSTNLPMLTVSRICEYAQIPSNYFLYTPWRSLSGLGGFTNDATVGHPHGFTNDNTAAGGTNFPGLRETWYTTDYGYAAIPDILDQLRYTPTKGSAWYIPSGETNRFQGIVTRTSYAAAMTAAKALYVSFPGFHENTDLPDAFSKGTYLVAGDPFGNWSAWYTANYWYRTADLYGSTNALATNINPVSYTAIWDHDFDTFATGAIPTVATYDSNGFNVKKNDWTYEGYDEVNISCADTNATYNLGKFGMLDNTTPPNDAATPASGYDNSTFRGWEFYAPNDRFLQYLDWTAATNGFVYYGGL